MKNLILYFLVGVIGSNGIPHYVKGITGNKHKTPFKNPTSAPGNILWGMFNFLISFLLFLYAKSTVNVDISAAGLSFLVGMLFTGFLLARHWQNDPKSRGEL